MKKLTLLLLSSVFMLSANEKEALPYSRSDTTDIRDKAIEARDKLNNSIRGKAKEIYKSRLTDDVKSESNITTPAKNIIKVESNTTKPENNITKDTNLTISKK